MTRRHPVNLNPATDAIMAHVTDNLDRAEKYNTARTEFVTRTNFMWDNGTDIGVVGVSVTAKATHLTDCYTLTLAFTGTGADEFRVNHHDNLVALVTATLNTSGWVLAKLRDDQEPKTSTSRDGIFFTLTRRSETDAAEEKAIEPGSIELSTK